MQRTLIIAGVVVLAAIGVYSFMGDDNGSDPNATPSASVSTTPGATPTGSSAAAAQALKAFLVVQTKVSANDIVISDVEEKQWSNSCLDVQRAGVVCAQVITPGYRMKATVKGEVYYYHTDRAGVNIVRER